MTQESQVKEQSDLNLPPLLLKPLRFKIALGAALAAFVSVGLVVILACYVLAIGKSCVVDMSFHWISLMLCAGLLVYFFSSPLISNILSGRIVRAWLYMLWLGFSIAMVDFTVTVLKMVFAGGATINPKLMVFLFAQLLMNYYLLFILLLSLIVIVLFFALKRYRIKCAHQAKKQK